MRNQFNPETEVQVYRSNFLSGLLLLTKKLLMF
jgi:hypothetical protein